MHHCDYTNAQVHYYLLIGVDTWAADLFLNNWAYSVLAREPMSLLRKEESLPSSEKVTEAANAAVSQAV